MGLFDKKDCPEYKAPEPPTFPRFCSRCGSALVPEVGPLGYDERTGAPKFYYWLRCPQFVGESTVLWGNGQGIWRAAFLNSTYTGRLHPLAADFNSRDYLDCSMNPKPPLVPPTTRSRAKS